MGSRPIPDDKPISHDNFECLAPTTQVIAALRSTEASWHHLPADAGGDTGGRGSFDGRGGSEAGGGGGTVRMGSESEELYKMYSDHIEVQIGCLNLRVHSPLFPIRKDSHQLKA